uniref:Formate--tetrahydrofolate ligase n=1 Tax=uncultured bacterium Contig1552 TaxID=1393454 RepID=W0FQ22_9BACT|nr:formate-tetrahydrofolate ligase [uncultured bacterium Contig1552]
MLSDIQIAQNAKIKPITEVAVSAGIDPDKLDLYGKYKAKIPLDYAQSLPERPDAKLVLVTAMNPTPAGEGKTTVSIGLAQGLKKIGKNPVLALREPSLGPVFGVKGGACGGGYSQVVPMEDINLHFTGDIHAITTANNLLAAMIDNHLFQGNALNLDKDRILWKRCLDMNDRCLRAVTVGVGGGTKGVTRPEIFQITAASEIMAILCLAKDMKDLKVRLDRIAIAYDLDGNIVTAGQLGATGALAACLKDALAPNLVQSLEGVPALVHGGPFANISHGCNTCIATKTALKLSDIVVTEAGFGADLGAEKFLDIKCRDLGIWPDLVVLVTTVRSLKYNAGIPKDQLSSPNPEAVRAGLANVLRHIKNMQGFGIPVLVASNRFLTDTEEELAIVEEACKATGAEFAPAEIFAKGGEGGIELANKALSILEQNNEKKPCYSYELTDSVEDKIRKVATKVYGAGSVDILPEAQEKINGFVRKGYGDLPICIAKTQYSLSDDPKKLGNPEGFTLTVRDCYISAGAGYLVILTGTIVTMPGLPPHPAAMDIDIDNDGVISGLF